MTDEGPWTGESLDDERFLGRLFALTDGVFAIAMTLLIIDVKLPDLADDASTHAVLSALGDEWPRYGSFLISFYVIASYWRRHHAVMRDVSTCTPRMVRSTTLLLLAVCTMPFAAALLGRHGDAGGVAVAVYAAVNVVAMIALALIRVEARRHTAQPATPPLEQSLDVGVYVIAVPAAFVFPAHSVLILFVALGLAGTAARLSRRRRGPR
ncbi:TMEM175 family protein [Williamsia sp. SKLECPSW1]